MSTQPKSNSDAKVVEKLVPETLERLFGNQHCHYDVWEGTVLSASDVRIIYVSADVIAGVYDALSYEAGDAWKIILKNCGYIWGKRVSVSLERELRMVAREELSKLTVKDYLKLLESYFATHGWGRISTELENAQQHGIVRVSLTNSLFVNALDQVDGRVDFMIAGMLRGIFEAISGHDLDCVQVCCERADDAEACEFLISAPARIRAIDDLIAKGIGIDDAVNQLRAA